VPPGSGVWGEGQGSGVWGFGVRGDGQGSRILGLGSGVRVEHQGSRVWGLGVRFWVLWFRVESHLLLHTPLLHHLEFPGM